MIHIGEHYAGCTVIGIIWRLTHVEKRHRGRPTTDTCRPVTVHLLDEQTGRRYQVAYRAFMRAWVNNLKLKESSDADQDPEQRADGGVLPHHGGDRTAGQDEHEAPAEQPAEDRGVGGAGPGVDSGAGMRD